MSFVVPPAKTRTSDGNTNDTTLYNPTSVGNFHSNKKLPSAIVLTT